MEQSDDERKVPLRRELTRGRISRRSGWRGLAASAALGAAAVILLAAVTVLGIKYFGEDTLGARVVPAIIARISRPMPDGVLCVTSTYNNDSAEFSKDKVERCDGKSEARPRLRSMLNWYGK